VRITIPWLSRIPILGAFFTRVYPFEIIIVVIAAAAWYLLYRTPFGLRLRACGDNPAAVDAAGADVAKLQFRAVVISGALSGLAGICFAYSILAKFSGDIYMGYGYLAIAGYIFGNWNLLPTLGGCLIFGFARSAGYQVVQLLGMPSAYSDLVMILPYVVTLVLLVFLSKHNRAPKALGEIYDKSKR
jgi:general nucleoside transport system permease protein